MKRLLSATSIVIPLVLLIPLSVGAQNALPSNAQRALQWLQCTQQQPNGQIGNGGNPIARSSEVALGLAAAGQPASAIQRGGPTLGEYLTTAVSTDVGTNGELLLARASQSDAGPTATVAAQLQAAKSTSGATKGEYGTDIYSDALAVLGLRAAGQPVDQDSIDFLKAQQKSDGGWSADNADQFGTDSNTTALVIQALVAATVPSTDAAITNGFTYLQSVFSSGGFGDAPGLAPDPNSDELGIQAIIAAGQQGTDPWQSRLSQALTYLSGQQLASGTDRGAIASSFSKLFATTLAPAVFLLRPLTVVGRAQTVVALLPCPTTAPASASPGATATAAPPTTTARLAQTGRPYPDRQPWPILIGGLCIAAGLSLRRLRRRTS